MVRFCESESVTNPQRTNGDITIWHRNLKYILRLFNKLRDLQKWDPWFSTSVQAQERVIRGILLCLQNEAEYKPSRHFHIHSYPLPLIPCRLLGFLYPRSTIFAPAIICPHFLQYYA